MKGLYKCVLGVFVAVSIGVLIVSPVDGMRGGDKPIKSNNTDIFGDCFYALSYDYNACVRTNYIIKQNDQIIKNQETIIKNQEIIKCYMLNGRIPYFGHDYGEYQSKMSHNPVKIVEVCGK